MVKHMRENRCLLFKESGWEKELQKINKMTVEFSSSSEDEIESESGGIFFLSF